jgi:hypothetical protein
MPPVVDIDQSEEFSESSKPPFRTDKPKTKSIPRWQVTPEFLTPAAFPPDAAAILKQNRITRKQFTRFAEAIALQGMRQCGADFLITMQRGIRLGDNKSMELFAKMAGLLKNDAATVINLGQSVSVSVDNGARKHFDSIVRKFDERDHRSRVEPPVITVEAITETASGDVA